ncbi:hypothetical protein ERO13_D06G140400v2 [Gossypium hirsutum]|uniref:Senescence regulator n=6 Tax=Gossypium TaxID=3633 RepID=A0A0D2VB71_GOSRA|nr:uncharacterized protein LOC105772259 [Gossypium raimondii]XP_016681493.1 uncharacterized protein LOC107900390 [Gossypium hirsutum]KAB2025647.1 hypothetical protein ES319_D06G164600v1 [Gossypium barbadense]TYG65301.1 hypothetical protein ES288_D06G175700v1 [Gossypium darwinii]TYH67277.1 hypothetical protein ES332_D06G177800v1 [Gossypium tomentosum]TYI77780.1 hypothetical protein E1A91_D06G166300v1 [Gossypium mustelinum]KAG4142613.1 hypothetical protein ERO13_D06G140400v2 [Gossypium hirsutum
MAEEEFQESEVVFSDHNSNHYGTHDEDAAVNDDEYFDYRGFSKNSRVSRNYKSKKNNSTTKKNNNKMAASSLPVNIPRQHGATVFHCDGEADEYDDGGMVPPHVILGRRIAGKMAFSVCTGNGRTLKGRDLSQVRNSVLRMTGFLEA